MSKTTAGKIYSARNNTIRAARTELGADKAPGVDFEVIGDAQSGFAWRPLGAVDVDQTRGAPTGEESQVPGAGALAEALSADEVRGVQELNAGIRDASKELWKRHPNNPENSATAAGRAMHKAMLDGATPEAAIAAATGATSKPKRGKVPPEVQATSDPAHHVCQGTAARGSKGDTCIDLMRRPGGATAADMMAATGWQPHTVRGFVAGNAKKRFEVTSAKVDGVTVYSIPAGAAEPADAADLR